MNGEELRDPTQFLGLLNHKFKPREVSYWTLLFGSAGTAGIALYVIWAFGWQSGITLIGALGEPQTWLLVLGIALIVVAATVEVVSRLRPCCPWRVKEQLKLALYTANLLPLDKREWKHLLRVGRAKRCGNGLLSVRFKLLGAKCNQESMDRIAASSSFNHAQNCEIKPYINWRGRVDGWVLYVWFIPMSDFYENVFGGRK